jgi:hypothetical protein
LGGGELVVHPESIAAGFDKTSAAQIGQMPRGGGLWHVEDIDEITDAKFATEEEAKNAESGRVGASPEGAIDGGVGFGFHIFA